MENAAAKIRVNSIAPGLVDTPMFRRDSSPELEKAVLSRIPMGRMGLPEDIASAAVFLASDESSFVTGIDMPVDGGYLIL